MKAIIYLRVSTQDQADSGLGLDAQMSACLKKAGELGATEILTFTDAGVSGATEAEKRPGLAQALATVRSGDVIIVAKRDRLSRDLDIASAVEKTLRKKKVRFISAAGEGSEPLSEDTGALMQRRMFQVFAEIERQMIRDRTRQALAVKKSRNERTGNIPYGYMLSDDGIHLESNPDEQRTIDYIHTLRAAGLSFEAVVRRLNGEGVRTRKGAPWQLRVLWRIAKRPT